MLLLAGSGDRVDYLFLPQLQRIQITAVPHDTDPYLISVAIRTLTNKYEYTEVKHCLSLKLNVK